MEPSGTISYRYFSITITQNQDPDGKEILAREVFPPKEYKVKTHLIPVSSSGSTNYMVLVVVGIKK